MEGNMPPKVKVTKEDIIKTAVELVRQSGADALNARSVAAALECSTQPIFSNFATMDELRFAVIKAADTMCGDYISREVAGGKYPPYKASGMAYIRFAKEEKELFKLLYMRDRSVAEVEASAGDKLTEQMESRVHDNTGLVGDDTKLFHLEMWVVVHGIASMLATGFIELDWELISKMLTDTYMGLKKQYGVE